MRVAALLLLGIACAIGGGCTKVSLRSRSADGKVEVEMLENGVGLDRNFRLRLRDLSTGAKTIIFLSPDEGRPSGTERIIWTRDGGQFLLIGRHLFVNAEAAMANGDRLYLWYDVKTKRLCCNARQQTQYPIFSPSEVASQEWAEPLNLVRPTP